MKKLLLAAIASASVLASCVKDDPYVAPPAPPVVDSPLKGKLVLNEINGTGEDSEKYIEFYNTTESPISLEGIVVWYNNATSDPEITWTGTAGMSIAAGDYYVLLGTKKGTLNPASDMIKGLSAEQAITVEMKDADGKRVDIFQKGVSVGNTQSFSRVPNGTGGWYYTAESEGDENPMSTAGLTPIIVVPVITNVAQDPASPGASVAATVSADVTAGDGTLESVVLTWTLGGVAQTAIPMTKGAGNSYSAQIPGQANGAVVAYTITATNSKTGISTATGGYTAGASSLATTGQVYVNECDPTGKVWELYNAETYAINLEGWSMTKDNNSSNNPFTFPAGATISGGGYLLLAQQTSNGTYPYYTGYGMSPASGFKYVLFDATGARIDSLDNFGDNQLNGAIASGQTLGRKTDGAAKLVMFTAGSPGTSNGANSANLLSTPVVFIKSGWVGPASPTSTQKVGVRANITYKDAITDVKLAYDFGAGFVNITMNAAANGFTYNLADSIPAKGSGGAVTYKFVVTPGGEVTNAAYTYTVTDVTPNYAAIKINELDGNTKFIELYNTSAAAVDISGMKIKKNGTAFLLKTSADGGGDWAVPASTSIPANSWMVITLDKGNTANSAPAGTKISLVANDGLSARQHLLIQLYRPDGTTLVDTFDRNSTPPGLYDGNSITEDYSKTVAAGGGGVYSFARVPDGSGSFVLTVESAGLANTASQGAIVTN